MSRFQTGRPVSRKAAACAYLLILAALMGCRPPNDKVGSGKLRAEGSLVVMIGPEEKHPQWPAIRGGARRHAAQVPYLTYEFLAPTSAESNDMLELVSGVIDKKPVVICMYIADELSAKPAVARIIDAGIVLVTMGRRVPDIVPFAHVDVDFVVGAELLGKNLLKVAAGRQSYILVHADGYSVFDTRCYQRFALAAGQQQSLRQLEGLNLTETDGTARDLIMEALQRFPRTRLVVTLDPQPWLAAPEPVLGDVRFATLGASPPLWPRLRNGEALALVGAVDGDIGYAAIGFALESVAGKKAAALGCSIECELVTPESLDDFVRRYTASAWTGAPTSQIAGTASQPNQD